MNVLMTAKLQILLNLRYTDCVAFNWVFLSFLFVYQCSISTDLKSIIAGKTIAIACRLATKWLNFVGSTSESCQIWLRVLGKFY